MAEKISVLFAVPIDADAAQVDFLEKNIEAQTYPKALVDFIKVEYVPTAPGARVSALNAARESASGAYVVLAGLDEMWDSHKLERQVAHLQSNLEYAGCIHPMTGGQYNLQSLRAYGLRLGVLLDMSWGAGAMMMTREAMDALGAYRSVEESTWEYATRFVDRSHRMTLMDEELAVWQGKTDRVCQPLVASGVRHRFLTAYLQKADVSYLFGEKRLVSELQGRLVQNALYQKNDDLEAAHTICQQIDGENRLPESSYWHGIIHRREPDFDNARGWFGRAENLDANEALYRATNTFLQQVIQQPDYGSAREIALSFMRHLQDRGTWDPLYVVDLCEQVANDDQADLRRLLEEFQEIEFDTLLDWTFRKAVGEI